MTLQDAKDIADNPSGFEIDQWQDAKERLEKTRSRIYGAQSNDRIVERFERRMQKLDDYLGAVVGGKPHPSEM